MKEPIKEPSNKTVAYCKTCGKDQKASIKMWSTIVCDTCNIIISSNKGIERFND